MDFSCYSDRTVFKVSDVIFSIIRLVIPLYIALDVYGATTSKWRAFGAFLGLAIIISLIELVFVWMLMKMNPCPTSTHI